MNASQLYQFFLALFPEKIVQKRLEQFLSDDKKDAAIQFAKKYLQDRDKEKKDEAEEIKLIELGGSFEEIMERLSKKYQRDGGFRPHAYLDTENQFLEAMWAEASYYTEMTPHPRLRLMKCDETEQIVGLIYDFRGLDKKEKKSPSKDDLEKWWSLEWNRETKDDR